MDLFVAYWGSLKFALFNTAWIFVVMWGIERLWPRGENASNYERGRALKYWALYILAGALVTTVAGALAGNPTQLYRIPLSDWFPEWALLIVGPLAGMALYDFFNYWMHRAQHKWFWKQHAIHHSIEHLSGLNSYFHPTEHLFRLAFIALPMTYLVGIEAGAYSLAFVILILMHGNFIHSATKLNFGPLGRLIVDNRWHRIHHSVEPRHFDKNFGTGVTIWDHLFGTAYVPAKDEWPAVGVHDTPEAASVRDFLLLGSGKGRSRDSVPAVGSVAGNAPCNP